MPTVTTPLGAAVDAIQRVPVACWLGPYDNPNGFPNYPAWWNDVGPVDALDDATRAVWDGTFGSVTARLIAAIGADPAKIPADTSALDRAALLVLYPDAVPEPDPQVVTP